MGPRDYAYINPELGLISERIGTHPTLQQYAPPLLFLKAVLDDDDDCLRHFADVGAWCASVDREDMLLRVPRPYVRDDVRQLGQVTRRALERFVQRRRTCVATVMSCEDVSAGDYDFHPVVDRTFGHRRGRFRG